MKRDKVIVLTGPTAVGKSKLSIELAKKIGGEIISADSMQVYRYMDIGSAKISREEMDNVNHHLIDCFDPNDEFNVYLFKHHAVKAMEEIRNRGNIPIFVGGTGFYLQAVLYDIDFSNEEDHSEIRADLEEKAARFGVAYLHEELRKVDEEAAEEIHQNNVKRVIRALEYYYLTGSKISVHNKEQRKKSSPYNVSYFVLNEPRENLYKKIDARVDLMIKDGLEEEVRSLMEKGYDRTLVSMQGLGYKEMIAYLNKEITLEEAVYRIKRDTRHFAKRQITWFKREKEVIWLNKEEFDYDEKKILSFMLDKIRE